MTFRAILRFILLILLVNSGILGKSVSPVRKTAKSHRPLVQIEPLSTHGKIKDPRHSNHGQHKPKQGPIPDPVFISSSIRINNGAQPPVYQHPKSKFGKEVNKRQIIIDGSQYLAAQQAHTPNAEQTYYYAQPNQQQFTIQQDASGALFGTPSPVQYQAMTALPVNTPNQGQLYLLQPSPTPYTQILRPQQTAKFNARTGETEEAHAPEASAVVTQPKVTIVSHADPNAQQDSGKRENAPKEHKTQQQIQHEEAQQVLQNIIKQQALQQTQQQRQHQFQLAQQIQEQFYQQAAQQAQQQAAQAQVEAQQQVVAAQQALSENQIVISPSPAPLQSTLTHAQYQQAPQQQVYQVHAPAAPVQQVQRVYQAANGQTYIVHQNAAKQPETEERPAATHVTTPQGGNFVIRHQTYVAGPGGQMFTVPVPIPAEQTENSHEENSGEGRDGEKDRERDDNSREADRRDDRDHAPPAQRQPHRPINSFMRRVMEAFSVRGDTSERLGTNIALPILASTGVFFGLGALAAGWYLSNANREVGILRRTGKPVPPGTHNVKRIRRQLPPQPHSQVSEVDQATFFQSIIQQAIEKQQEEFEAPAAQDEPIHDYQLAPFPKQPSHKHRKPLSRHDVTEDSHHSESSPNSKVAHYRPMQKKAGLFSRQALNFAKVAIPAIILGGAVIAIGVLIFGWYITGSNREIAFLEPSAYSRRKRDLTTTALSDGWLQRVLNSIHENPYAQGPLQDKGFNPFADDGEKSKGNLAYRANISDAVVAVSLAVIAFFSLLGIVFAWLAAQNEKSNLGVDGSYGFGGWPGSGHEQHYRRAAGRAKRSFNPALTHNPIYLAYLQSKFENAQQKFASLETM